MAVSWLCDRTSVWSCVGRRGVVADNVEGVGSDWMALLLAMSATSCVSGVSGSSDSILLCAIFSSCS